MASEVLSPFVYWGQNSQYVFLKVDIKDATDPEVKLDDEKLDFKANGIGVGGRHDYAFSVEFYLPIDDKKSRYRVTDRHLEFQVEKQGIGQIWPRLMVKQQKPAWLKIDFDKFAVEDDSDDEVKGDTGKDDYADAELMRKIERDMLNAKDSAVSDLKSIWLFVYNLFQWVGFSYVFIALCLRYMNKGEVSKFEAVETVGTQLMVCQIAAILEIIHPALGLVKTGIFTPLMQIFGRNLMLFVIVLPEERLHDEPLVWWLFVVWSAIEIIRYPFYMLSSLGKNSRVITWLRYTMWIPLYPAGFALEGLAILKAIPMYEMTGKWSLELPNLYNMSFSFPMFLRVYILLFLMGMYFLLKRMYVQRKHKLGSTQKKKRS